MAIGIYGGNFDPIHNGHLITAQYVSEIRKLEKVIFVPANISPNKTETESSEGKHRYTMVNFAIQQSRNFIVSDIELKRDGVSYTIDTLKELKKSYNDIELIVGYDNLISFDEWKNPDEVLELCELIVLKRKVDKEAKKKNKYFKKATILDTPTIEISSTEIRKRIQNGLPIDYLVPQIVKEYIYENGLYK